MSFATPLLLAQAAPAYGQGADISIPWARIILAFLFCIAVAAGAILWLRARQGRETSLRALVDRLAGPAAPTEQVLVVEDRLRASPTSQYLILRCGARRYLVHQTAQSAVLLDRLDDAGETAP